MNRYNISYINESGALDNVIIEAESAEDAVKKVETEFRAKCVCMIELEV